MSKTINCAFCNSLGNDPYKLLSPMSGCLVCEGTGRVEVEEPSVTCVFCSGTGKNPLGARVPCIVCGGKGSNFCKSTIICNLCKGTGKDRVGLPCLSCKGKGFC